LFSVDVVWGFSGCDANSDRGRNWAFAHLTPPLLPPRNQPDDAAIYDSVSEEQYKEIVGNRLERDDFIEDDDGSGYQDNGMDVWEGRGRESDDDVDDDEDDRPRGELNNLRGVSWMILNWVDGLFRVCSFLLVVFSFS
jgi:hypothetical protein